MGEVDRSDTPRSLSDAFEDADEAPEPHVPKARGRQGGRQLPDGAGMTKAQMNEYQRLFREYVSELRLAKEGAIEWWNNLLARETSELGSRDEAEREIAKRWPFGPPSHPYINAVYRKYFIACERLNELYESSPSETDVDSEEKWGTIDNEDESAEELDDIEGPVDPPILLLEMLAGRDDDLADFMAGCVYSPIGEENGRSI